MRIPAILFACVLALAATALPAQEPAVRADLLLAAASVEPGSTITAGVRLRMAPGWHVSWRNPGDSGLAVRVDWELPTGFTAGPLRWPTPRRFAADGSATFGYAEEVVLLANIVVAADAAVDGPVRIAARCAWLACAEACVPGKADLERLLPAGNGDPGPEQALLRAAETQLPAALPPDDLRVETATLVPATPARLELRLAGTRAGAIVDAIPEAIPGCVVDHGAIRVESGRVVLPIAAPAPGATPAFVLILVAGRGPDARGFAVTVPGAIRTP